MRISEKNGQMPGRNGEVMRERETFGSRLGFILVSAGCAVGLGNVWKFPYICGQYGGAAFILIYLVFLALLGLPILICEFAAGRGSGCGMGAAFERLEQKGTSWHHLKWISICGSYLLMMFYTMVGGWMLYYAYQMAAGRLSGLQAEEVAGVFSDMLGSAPRMTVWMIVAVVLAFAVCGMGLTRGIEKVTKVMMSILIVLMVILALHSLILPGAMEGVRFYLVPDFGLVKQYGMWNVVYAAMSHAFFTLSVGIGAMEIFGSYLKKERGLTGEAAGIVVLDTFVALMAGFIIIPACFAYGVEPDSGPSLLFITLPNVFNNMSGGRIWGTCFFVFMSFAALSTIIAVFENILSFFMDMGGWERKKAVRVNVILIILLSLPAVLGFNLLSGVQPMGAGSTIMDAEDFLVSYNLLPLGSMVFVLFCVKKNGWGFSAFLSEVNAGEGGKLSKSLWLQYYMTYVLPCIIVVVYLKGYYDMFREKGKVVLAGWMTFAVALLALIFLVTMKKPGKGNESG